MHSLRFLIAILMLITFSGLNFACSSTPKNDDSEEILKEEPDRSTPYIDVVEGELYGKKVRPLSEDVFYATFSGNRHTSKSKAKAFAQMTAVEYCFKRDKLSLTVTDSDTSSGRFVGVGFRCLHARKAIPNLGGVENLPPGSLMKFTKDFLGGVLVQRVKGKGNLQKGDVITRVNGQRINQDEELMRILRAKNTPISADLEIVRNQKLKKLKVKLQDVTPSILAYNILVTTQACSYNKGREPAIPMCDTTVEFWLNKYPQVKPQALLQQPGFRKKQ